MPKQTPWIITPLVALALLLLTEAFARVWQPHPARLPEEFSAAYLERLARPLALRHPTLALGDSVLWGFHLPPDGAALAILGREHPEDDVVNLSYEGGSPVNDLAMYRYLRARGVHPAALLINVNLKEFNPADSAYRRLYPAVEELSRPLMPTTLRDALDSTNHDSFAERAVSKLWALYALRPDLKEMLFGAADAATLATNLLRETSGAAARERAAHVPTADRFLGTYDLTPLTKENLSMRALARLAADTHEDGVPMMAILTPTNHELLHEEIDAPEYRANLSRVSALLRSGGARVLNLDAAFTRRNFLDNDHLTPAGNQRLARILGGPLGRLASR